MRDGGGEGEREEKTTESRQVTRTECICRRKGNKISTWYATTKNKTPLHSFFLLFFFQVITLFVQYLLHIAIEEGNVFGPVCWYVAFLQHRYWMFVCLLVVVVVCLPICLCISPFSPWGVVSYSAFSCPSTPLLHHLPSFLPQLHITIPNTFP